LFELNKAKLDFKIAIKEFFSMVELKEKEILIVGCSTSEIQGGKIGTFSSQEIASTLLSIIMPMVKKNNIFLAVQCCEHLNRVLVVDEKCAKEYNLPLVTVIPYPEAGGSLSSCYYKSLDSPVVVEEIQADAGLDIGDTFIGMHLKKVAIPTRLSVKKIGNANLTAAKTRPKLIGGERARYK